MAYQTEAPRFSQFQILVRASDETRVFPLPMGVVVSIGRDPENTIVIDDPLVSGRHVLLSSDASQAIVEHTAADNETLLLRRSAVRQGIRMPVASLPNRKQVPIEIGDRLILGSAVLLLKSGAYEVPASPELLPERPCIVVDAAMRTAHALVKRAAATESSVLILGERGVGKNVLAHAVHEHSARSHAPLTVLSCAALADNRLDVGLFGPAKGAFTATRLLEQGLLQASAGGTIVLDEIGELPLPAQETLLSTLEPQLPRVAPIPQSPDIAVRFVSTTSRDLLHQVRNGTFRRDLYFRISGVIVQVPPLRDRAVEIAPLARAFARNFCTDLGQPEAQFDPAAIDILERYQWPGNVRELKNVVECAVLLGSPGPIDPVHLQIDAERLPSPATQRSRGSRGLAWLPRPKQSCASCQRR